MQTQLSFAVLRGPHSRWKLLQNYFRLHSRYRYREILFSNYFRYEFGQTVLTTGRAIHGPMPVSGKLSTNFQRHWSIQISLKARQRGHCSTRLSPEIHMDQWSGSVFVGDWYDWTTGGPNDGNEWRKYRVVPRVYPLHPLGFACFSRVGSKGAFRLPGATWDRFRCTVESLPGQPRFLLTD